MTEPASGDADSGRATLAPAAAAEAAGGHDGSLLKSGDDDPLQMILWDMAQSTWLSESSVLAETIQGEFNRALGIPDRGVKQAPLRVLVGATMPAVLVEVGFITNRQEEKRLRDPQFVDLIVTSLTRAIESYDDRMRRRTGGSVGWNGGSDRSRP